MFHTMPDRDLTTAYSYVRFSSEGQSEGTSIERQTKRAQEWCEREGYRLSTETFEDLGVSAFKGTSSRQLRAAGSTTPEVPERTPRYLRKPQGS